MINFSKLIKTIIAASILLFGIVCIISSSGGGGGGGSGEGENTNIPVSEMTFSETYSVDIEDRRETFRSTLGVPDTFKIDVTEIEGHTVVSEEWSYINLGVRLDIVDGEVAYVIPIDEVELDLAFFPRFYDPSEFEPPMNRNEAMKILDGQVLEEYDLSAGGYEGLEIVAGDQILLGFDGDQLVYVETFAIIPDPDGELDNLFIDDLNAEGASYAINDNYRLNEIKIVELGKEENRTEVTSAPVIIKGIFGIFRAFSKRNKVYREANAMLRDYKEYLQKLHDKAAELALDPCGINLIDGSTNRRLSNGATLIRIKTRLLEELNAVTALLEDEKNEARKKFYRDLIKTVTDYLTESGALAKVLNKIGVAKIRDSIAEADDLISGAYDPGNLQNFHTSLSERMSKLGVIGESIGGVAGSALNRVIAKIQRQLPGVKQSQQAVEEIRPLLQQLDQELANIQQQFSPGKKKRPFSSYQIVGTVEAIMEVLDDPEIDALSAALAKEMEPGIAKNQLIANGRLDPKQFLTLRERIRGAILQSGAKRIEDLKPEYCGHTSAPDMREEYEISARMLGAGIYSPNAEMIDYSIMAVTPQAEGYAGQTDVEGSPIPVCDSFPADLRAAGQKAIEDIEKGLYVDPPKDGCNKDYDKDGVNGQHVNGSDCDDRNPNRYPGNTEVCDQIDNDCNDIPDDGLSTDFDLDNHFSEGSCQEPNDDCDDLDEAINPGATEICDDDIDNNCDDKVDCDDPECVNDDACSDVCPTFEGTCGMHEQSAGLTLTYWIQSPPPWGGPPLPYCKDESGNLLTAVHGGLTTVEILKNNDWDENWNGWLDSQVLTCGYDVPAGGILICAEGVDCDQACETIEGTCSATEQSSGLTLKYLLMAQPPYTGPPIPYCEGNSGTLFTPTIYGLRNAEVIEKGVWNEVWNGWWDSGVLTCGYDVAAGGVLTVVE